MLENSLKKSQRIEWIDVARGIAMICIIIGHGTVPHWFRRAIFSFHIPLFFILSGMVYKKRTNSIIKDFRHLMLPYLTTVGILAVCNILKMRSIDFMALKDLLKASLFGFGASNHTLNVSLIGAIWFLPTIFFARRFMDLLFSWELTFLPRTILVIGFVVLGLQIGKITWCPLNVDIAMVAVGYVYLGYCMRQYTPKLDLNIAFSCFVIWCACYVSGANTEFAIRLYGGFVSIICAVVGCMVAIWASMQIESLPIVSNLLKWIGRHTLLILCIHDIDWRMPFSINSVFFWSYLEIPSSPIVSILNRLIFDFGIAALVVILQMGIRKLLLKKAR